jgi:hypothetical protein
MDEISVRYGAGLNLEVNSDDELATTATLYVGHIGELPVITKSASFSDGVAVIELDEDDTRVPLDTYKYQINVLYPDGPPEKFPDPENCEDCEEGGGLPTFKVCEALDETEVVS